MQQNKTNLKWLKNNIFNVLIGIIIVVCVFGRLTIYDDPRLSIATNDTTSYLTPINIPLFSWEAFTGRRLPSYTTFFKVFEPQGGYPELTAISYPAAAGVGTRHKELQPGYDNVVLAQMIFAIFAWVVFALVFARRLKVKELRPIAVFCILFFAFTPPIAEWDSILMSESISFSLFTLLSAITLELIFRLIIEKNKPGKITILFFLLWMILLPFWAFTRDSNANSLIIVFVFLALVLIIPKLRGRVPVNWIAGMTLYTASLITLYLSGTFEANRWRFGWTDIFYDWINGYPARKQFFIDRGMPIPWTSDWVDQRGPRTYLAFLFNHPGFMVTEYLGRLSDAFSENVQPFFFIYPTLNRRMLLAIGDIFHPLSSTAFVFPLFAGLLSFVLTIRKLASNNVGWLLFVIWLIAIIYGLYTASFFGDSAGLIRHSLGAVVYMRFMVWLLPLIIVEMAVSKQK